ncbi:MAG: ComEC/Rec2 family competence protein [Chlamydiales bacterium]|nr:ComEC/Rec2 family competence protein [Chlamydiales bacterium]
MKGPTILLQYVGLFFDSFWRSCPALYYGLFLYLGALAAFSWQIELIIPLLFLALYQSKNQKWRLILGLAAFGLFWQFTASYVVYPPSWADSTKGEATFEIIDSVHEMRYGRPYYKMKVRVLTFDEENKAFFAKNITCSLVWNNPATRPKADAIYRAQGTLTEYEGNWSLKLDKTPLLKMRPSYSLTEWRMSAKREVKLLLAKYLPSSQTRAFLEGVLIGEFHDAELAGSLKRFSLQHVTVVSGFHFSLIAVILASFFRLLLPWKQTNICLLIAITGYLLFIGPSPSVLRAWVAVTILFLGKLFEVRANGLNSLGIGLILVLCYDPACVTGLGFQLSFLATFAILLFYPLVDQMMRSYFPKRSASDLLKMPFSEQLLFVLLTFFISSLALVLSVSIFMLPMSLYCFETFPLMGLIYNCFFPFLVSISVFVVCLALLFAWITPLAAFLFSIAGGILDFSLTLITHAPPFCDLTLHANFLNTLSLTLYLSAVTALGILLKESKHA